jgi:hypothetical protein
MTSTYRKQLFSMLFLGRINIVDLAQHLRIDLSYIESKIGDVCKEDPTLQFTLGQFISA